MKGEGALTGNEEQRWRAGVLRSDQVDAAAWVDAAVGDRGGGARVLVRRCEGGRRRRKRGENDKDPLPLFIRGWIQGMRGNRGG